MTNEEKKEWLSGKYPLTVIQDRYVGAYSGARWLAFPLDYTDVPEDANGDDMLCAQFWHDYEEPVGKGNCAEEAIDNLLMEMEASIPKEIDEEKVRKFLLRLAKRCPEDSLDFIGEVKKADVLAYLEKQKEQKSSISCGHENDTEWSERDKEIANFIFGLFEALLWRKDFSIDKECVLSWLCYRLPYLETKQKPAEWSEEDERILKGIIGKIGHDQTFGVSKVEMLSFLRSLRPQPKQEWSEEDEHRRKDAIYFLESAKKHYADTSEIEKTIDWLKSLRPQPSWKPSEEQMKALYDMVCGCRPEDKQLLQDLYFGLKKL